jgi:hypothetical protein
MNKLEIFTILLLAYTAVDISVADSIQGNSVPLTTVNIRSVAAKGAFFGIISLNFNSKCLF